MPFDQFKMLGMDKRDVINLPTRTLNALLTGNRTSLMRFKNLKLPGGVNPHSIDAKLSLASENGQMQLKIHPINEEVANIYQLSPEEIKQLQDNQTNFISKTLTGIDGTSKDLLISLDKTTNEFVGIDMNKVNAPEEINGTLLSDKQMADFREGKNIQIENSTFRLDPDSEIGVSGITRNNETAEIQSLKFKNSRSRYSSKELLVDNKFQSPNVRMIGHENDMARRQNSFTEALKNNKQLKTEKVSRKNRRNNIKL